MPAFSFAPDKKISIFGGAFIKYQPLGNLRKYNIVPSLYSLYSCSTPIFLWLFLCYSVLRPPCASLLSRLFALLKALAFHFAPAGLLAQRI